MSMAVGIPIGLGAGVAVGIASGRQSVRHQVCDYAVREQITILDSGGQPIAVEVFLEHALRQDPGTSRRWMVMALAATAGLVGLGVIALGLILWLT